MVAQPAPSPAFVGPMPAVQAVDIPASMVAQPAPSPAFVGPMPVQTVPLAGQIQAGEGQTGIWHADLGGAAMDSDGLPAMKTSLDQKTGLDQKPGLDQKTGLDQRTGAGIEMDQVRTRLQTADNAGSRPTFGTESGKTDPASVPGVTARDIKAYVEQTAAANQSSSGQSSLGQSSGGQSSGGQSASAQAVAASGGQTGGQTGGQNQSGQGGGQSASQGFVDAAPSRDLADRAMLHRLNTANAGWSETMIKRLTSDLRSGVQTVRIILEPRHLGRLNVDLGLRNGKASIRIAAETAEAAKLLGSARGQLGQMFEQSGMRLASFQTSAGGGDATMDGNGGQHGQAQSDADGKNTGRDQGFSNKLGAAGSDMRQAGDNLDDQDFVPRAGETAVLSVLA